MHGLGNDYLYIDRFSYPREHNWPELTRRMADRHFGVGSDGLILVEGSEIADFRMRMFNADGLEGEMCGNGMRCFARYVYENHLTEKTSLVVETGAGLIRPYLTVKDGKVESVSVDMGIPRLKRAEIPLAEPAGPEPVVNEPIEYEGRVLYATCVSMGNPHCVFFVDDVWEVELEKIGPVLEHHPVFPQRANIEFVAVRSRDSIDMRIWERGSGITLASGTGSSASVVATILNGKAGRGTPIKVNLPGGTLLVEWKHDGHIWQAGPATRVCTGLYYLDLEHWGRS
ncbi:MAG TPA: diaminopimelate epimerase [Firmicutes bacterium]|nr:diaminopimelate epimerase [Candidatus Fermentithermobacillaceae bacterium]